MLVREKAPVREKHLLQYFNGYVLFAALVFLNLIIFLPYDGRYFVIRLALTY